MKLKILSLILALIAFSSALANAQTVDFSKTSKAVSVFKADDFYGAAATSIPISVPPGRKGIQPDISLRYSSVSGNGWLGMGWIFDFGYIERSTKKGIPSYTGKDILEISFLGISSRLEKSTTIPNLYYPLTTSIFVKILSRGNYWELYDKEGRKYVFGQTPDSRMEAPKGTFRWALNKIVDSCGNYLTITYYKDNSQIYPLRVDYTGNENTLELPTHKVDFILEDRNDVISNYRGGYLVTTARRLKEIKTYVSGNLANRYLLEYISSGQTGRSLLSKFTAFGSDDTTRFPPLVFTYQHSNPPEYNNIVYTSVNSGNKRWYIKNGFGMSGNPTGILYPPKTTDGGTFSFEGGGHLYWYYTSSSGKTGDYWTTSDKGSLSVNLSARVPFYAWTYVYTETPKTISIPAVSSGNFFFWLNSDRTTPVNPRQINLKAGNNIIEITGYNADNAYIFDLNYALSDNVTRMHSNQFVIPQLSGDFNGDGLTDLANYQSDGSFKVAISQGQSFKPSELWPVYGFPRFLATGNGFSFLLGDFKGSNGRTDIMAINNISESELAVAVSNSFADDGSRSRFFTVKGTPFATDFNNDGVTDVGWQADNTSDILIALSVTSGMWPSSTWLTGFSGKILLGDFNGDGFTDIASYNSSQSKISVALNKGDVFDAPQAWLLNFTTPYELTGVDYNNDGLTDILYYDKTTGQAMVAVCAGNKFLTPKSCLSGFTIKDTDVALQTSDFNGDGLSDIYVFNPYTAKSELAYSTPNFVDLLIKTENGTGAELSIKYDSSVNYDNTISEELKLENPNEYRNLSGFGLPFGVPVIREINSSDGMGNSYKTKYSYKGGFYDRNDREFRGFNYVNIIDNENNQKEIYFKQGDIFKGRPYKEEYKDALGNLHLRITSEWARIGMGNDFGTGKFVFISRRDKYAFDGDATFKQSYTTSYYDTAYWNSEIIGGDLIRTFEGGDQTIARRDNQLKYAFIRGDSILSRPSLVYTRRYIDMLGGFGLAKKQLYYDYNDSFGAAPTRGLLTKEKVITVDKNSGNEPEANDTYALITSYTYDDYGNLLTTTGPENRASTITYDTAYHIYPVEAKNALNQINKSTYDPKTGQILAFTDSNNQITTYLYDSLGRITKVIGPLDTDAYPGVIYEYDLSSRPVKITKRYKTAYPSTYAEEYSFYDGLGRLIQTKLQAEDDPVTGQPRQIVKDVVIFNAQGKVKEKYNAYFVLASTLYSDPDTSIPKATFEYDCLNRLVKTINPDLTQKTIQYSDWTQTKTDENGHQIRSTYDALNRLVKQEEFNDSETYTTLYAYDLRDLSHFDSGLGGYRKHFKITDTRGNITEITYDLADRKLKISDPDIGIWNYTYDKAGNLKTQTDAKGQILSFDYDALNRLTKKAYPDGKSINYYFDDTAKSYCVGRLSYVADLSGRTDYYYDKLGRQVKEVNTIDGASYTVERAYNPQNQIISLRYPDNETLTYTYNKAGSVKTIQGAAPYVSNVDYSPNGQMLKVQYANGVYTAYAYDPNRLRLTDLKTNNGSLQNLNYRYDASGNISRITDYRNSASQDFIYDNLNRLIQANGAYGNFSYQYDSVGNMIYKEGVGYSYGQFSGERPHALTSGTDGFSAVYDANGNMISRGSETLTYDYDNRLSKLQSPSSGNTAVTLEITLNPGWNFITLPFIVNDNNVASLLSSISGKYSQVARYDPAAKKWEYYIPVYTDFPSQFSALETGKGYQVYISASSPCLLKITGRAINTNYSISLTTGWQMIGYPSKSKAKVSDALANLVKGTNYDRISRYDTATNTFVDLTSGDYLEPGVSYFIRVLKNSTWTVLPKPDVIDLTEFAYNADGSRVKKIVNGTATIYIDNLYEKTGSAITKHIFAGASRVCSVNTQTSSPANPQTYYYHPDHLGSSSVITNASGAQLQLAEYKPYGSLSRNEPANRQTGSPVHHYFTGKELDSTGLYYYGARYYDPKIGRFITADPIDYSDQGIMAVGGKNLKSFLMNPQNFNRYTYCLNNPLRYIDPMGFYVYDTKSWPIAFLHESSPFNANSTMRQQITSWGNFYTGNWARATNLSGQSIVSGTNWQSAYNWSQYISAGAVSLAIGANFFNAGWNTVAWSGKGAREIAMANKGIGIMLEETIGGRALNVIEQLIGNRLPLSVWKAASAIFAANAKGIVQVFSTETTYSGIFATVEAPIIEFMKNAIMILR